MQKVKIIETPRDAMQGMKIYIPADRKAAYINLLIQAGFHTVEVGSFVSPAAIPQMRDTGEVIKMLHLPACPPQIMVLVANRKGMDTAAGFEEINTICYPYSASPVFLQKNIGKSPGESLADIDYMQNLCQKSAKKFIVYITMAFGNPYGDPFSPDLISGIAEILAKKGIDCIPLSDITGEADPNRISQVFTQVLQDFPGMEFGLHLHARPEYATELVHAAWESGCRMFDTVLNGRGGCPMTGKELLANLDTLRLCSYLESKGLVHGINKEVLSVAGKVKLDANNVK